MVISDDIFAMLLTHAKFAEFTRKEIADATKVTEVLTSLAIDTKEKVDELVGAALKAGGSEAREPKDHGFMYERAFNDLDGHIWEIVWIDQSKIPKS